MHLWKPLFCLSGLLSVASPAPLRNSTRPIVDVGYAKYKGVGAAGVDHFLGIRFAQPPLGDLRWRAPRDPKKEKKIQDATKLKPVCIGTDQPNKDKKTKAKDLSEDCLYLNIYKPSNATSNSRLPVWFFIQGGGYAHDADVNINGTEVVQKSGGNIVFVQINYRVGSFGFLAGEEVRNNGDLNAGLLDQRKGLQWVQQHIQQFGGDPKHVVIHGDSAGAGSIIYHLTAYGGRDDGLFVGAISESPFLPYHMTVEQSEFQFKRYASAVGCKSPKNVMKCLRKKSSKELQKADVSSPFPGGRNETPLWYFTPVIDGKFSPDFSYPMLEQGRMVKVPLIVGDDNDEGSSFASNASSKREFYDFIKGNYPRLPDAELSQISALYPLKDLYSHHNPWFTPTARAYGESTFICPGDTLAQQMSLVGNASQVWHYHYHVYEKGNADRGWGTPHVAEKPGIFGPNSNVGCDKDCAYDSYDAPVVPIVMNYWLSFIRSLNPNTFKYEKAPVWDAFGRKGGQGKRLTFTSNSTFLDTIPDDQQERCQFWRNLAPYMQQ